MAGIHEFITTTVKVRARAVNTEDPSADSNQYWFPQIAFPVISLRWCAQSAPGTKPGCKSIGIGAKSDILSCVVSTEVRAVASGILMATSMRLLQLWSVSLGEALQRFHFLGVSRYPKSVNCFKFL